MSSGNRFDESIKQSESKAQDTGISNVGGAGSFETFNLGSGSDYVSPNSSKNTIDVGLGATANVNMIATDHGSIGRAFDLAHDVVGFGYDFLADAYKATAKTQNEISEVTRLMMGEKTQAEEKTDNTQNLFLWFFGLSVLAYMVIKK